MSVRCPQVLGANNNIPSLCFSSPGGGSSFLLLPISGVSPVLVWATLKVDSETKTGVCSLLGRWFQKTSGGGSEWESEMGQGYKLL